MSRTNAGYKRKVHEYYMGDEPSSWVKFFNNKSFNEATKVIYNGHDDVCVFRGIIKPREISMELDNCPMQFSDEKMTYTGEPYMYVSEKQEREKLETFSSLKEQLMGNSMAGSIDLSSRTSTRETYSQALQRISMGRCAPLYALNISKPKRTPSFLHTLPLHVNPKDNPMIDYSFGINEETFFIAGDHSFSDFHIEDAYLDSCNILHGSYGDDACKLWLLIPRRHFVDCNLAIRKSVWRLQENNCGELLQGVEHHCAIPANHKILSFTPDYFRDRGIEYAIVIQRPGDMIYVPPCVYHQVINIGITMAEAVNVGGNRWNVEADKSHICQCEAGKIQQIRANTNLAQVVRPIKGGFLMCPHTNCNSMFTKQTWLDAHLNRHSSNIGSITEKAIKRKFEYMCEYCSIFMRDKSNLNRHIKRIHLGQKDIKEGCPHCGKEFRRDHLKNHITLVHKGVQKSVDQDIVEV